MEKQVNKPKLRFPEFEGEWKKKRLVEVAVITTGSTPSTKVEDYYNGNRLFVSPADLQGNRYVEKTKTTLTELGFSKGRKIQKGSVLFVCIGSTIGKVGVPVEDCLTNQQINSLNARNDFSNNFIYSLLELNANEIKLLAGVQAVPQINKTAFSNLSFYFPTLQEQTKIASFLTAVDDKLQALKKKKTLLEQYKKGVMQKIFSQELRFKDDNGNDYPDWEEKKLGEVCNVVIGGTPSTTNSSYWNGNIGWIGSGELKNSIIKKPSKYITELGLKKSSTTLMPKGTTVLAMTGATLGRIGYLDIDCTGNQSVAGFVNLKELNSKFLFFQMQVISNQILSLAGGAAQAGINKSNIECLIILIPTLIEQTKISNFLSDIDDKINNYHVQIVKMEIWKKGLLQKMFC